MPRKRTDIQLPLALCDPRFSKTWERWKQYRIERRAKLTPTTQQMQLDECVRLGIDEAIRRMERSMLNGWQGLFEGGDKKDAAQKQYEAVKHAGEVYKRRLEQDVARSGAEEAKINSELGEIPPDQIGGLLEEARAWFPHRPSEIPDRWRERSAWRIAVCLMWRRRCQGL